MENKDFQEFDQSDWENYLTNDQNIEISTEEDIKGFK